MPSIHSSSGTSRWAVAPGTSLITTSSPLGSRRSSANAGTRMARVCVLVNAYTGNLEEVTAFGSPIRYLSEEEALDVVASAFQMERGQLRNPQTTLMFQPSDIGHVRSYPFWRVKRGDEPSMWISSARSTGSSSEHPRRLNKSAARHLRSSYTMWGCRVRVSAP